SPVRPIDPVEQRVADKDHALASVGDKLPRIQDVPPPAVWLSVEEILVELGREIDVASSDRAELVIPGVVKYGQLVPNDLGPLDTRGIDEPLQRLGEGGHNPFLQLDIAEAFG